MFLRENVDQGYLHVPCVIERLLSPLRKLRFLLQLEPGGGALCGGDSVFCLCLQTEDALQRKVRSRPDRAHSATMHILQGKAARSHTGRPDARSGLGHSARALCLCTVAKTSWKVSPDIGN